MCRAAAERVAHVVQAVEGGHQVVARAGEASGRRPPRRRPGPRRPPRRRACGPARWSPVVVGARRTRLRDTPRPSARVDAPRPQPTSATFAPASQLGLRRRRAPGSSSAPGWRRYPGRKNCSQPTKTSWSCSCQPTAAGAEACSMRGSALSAPSASSKAPGRNTGPSGSVSAKACSGVSEYMSVVGVVLDVAAGRLAAQPLVDVARRRCRSRAASSSGRRPGASASAR